MDFKPLVTLLAIVNPLAIVPFFIHYTHNFTSAQRKRTILIASFSAFVVIAVSALMGLHILAFFGISLASFQVGGGMLLLTSALATALCFALAEPIARFLGKTGINVMTRLMGLILAALAVEVMSDGLIKLFPVLGR